MYNRNTYTPSSGGDQPPYGYSSSYGGPPGVPPPPPPSHPQPPPPSQSWNGHYNQPQSDNRDVYQFNGSYSGSRQGYSDDHRQSYSDDHRQSYSDDRRRRDDRDRDRNYQPPQSDFTFRVDRPSGIDSYRPPEREQRAPRAHRDERGYNDERNSAHQRRSRFAPTRDSHRRNEERRQVRDEERERRSRRDRNTSYRGRNREHPSTRLLLIEDHNYKPELMLGDTTTRATYRDVDQLSDSDETEMDISDSDASNSEVVEPATKRARTSATVPTSVDQEVPKWSNPDPYTALPPPDESTRKKKDMVQLIRKARIEAEAKKPSMQTEGLDFISCDFSDDDGPKNGDKRKSQTLSNGSALAEIKQNSINKASATLSGAATLPPKPPVSTDQERVEKTIPSTSAASSGSKKNPVDLTASTSLGNRKRTIDDAIKLPHTSLKPTSKMPTDGEIVKLWKARGNENPCPWAVIDHSATPNMATRLHKEIMDFYEWVKPRDYEQHVRDLMVKNLTKLVKKRWPDANTFPFGSYMSGLYLPTGDMDIAICSDSFIQRKIPKYCKKTHLYMLRAHFNNHNAAYQGNIEVIPSAKVPLIKYTDNQTGLKVDISFEKLDGANAIKTFLAWKERYPVMPILVAVIKQFLLMRGLNEPVNGGIGGFSIICMVVNLLNQMPQVQSGSMNPEHHLGELLMEFFDYYGNRFQYETVAIRMNPPGLVNKNDVSSVVYRNFDRLSILDPNDSMNDISGGSKNTSTILASFSRAHLILRERMARLAQKAPEDAGQTLLSPLFAGGYSCFVDQRKYLERLAAQGLSEYVPQRHPQW